MNSLLKRKEMDNKQVSTVLLCLVLCLFCGGIGFVAGQRYERENSNYLRFRLDDQGMTIEGNEPRKNGHVRVWPFVDVETHER
jgi:hypothetical protein